MPPPASWWRKTMVPAPSASSSIADTRSRMIASPSPARNSSISIAVDRSRTHRVASGSSPASRIRPAVNSYGALPPAPGASPGPPGEPAEPGRDRGVAGDDPHREAVVELPDDVQPAGCPDVHGGHPQAAEGEVGGPGGGG